MKKILILALLECFLACKSGSNKAIKADTSIVFAGYRNPYIDATAIDTCFMIIQDSVHIEGDKAIHRPDTTFYVKTLFPVRDPKDSTHKARLKASDGQDSVLIRYMPVPPNRIFQIWGAKIHYKAF